MGPERRRWSPVQTLTGVVVGMFLAGLGVGLARDLGPYGIRVNTLVPGWVMTEKQLRLWVNEQTSKQIDEQQCLPSRLEPADIARMALFLAADDSRMCTAQDFVVDGGWT